MWWLKRFYEGLKTFIKPFEAPQWSVKLKISVNFFSSSGAGRVNIVGRDWRNDWFTSLLVFIYIITKIFRPKELVTYINLFWYVLNLLHVLRGKKDWRILLSKIFSSKIFFFLRREYSMKKFWLTYLFIA